MYDEDKGSLNRDDSIGFAMVEEMEQRYQDMQASRVRHIDVFNDKVRSGEITAPLGSQREYKPYPYIVAIVVFLCFLESLLCFSRKLEAHALLNRGRTFLSDFRTQSQLHTAKSFGLLRC